MSASSQLNHLPTASSGDKLASSPRAAPRKARQMPLQVADEVPRGVLGQLGRGVAGPPALAATPLVK